MRLPASLFLCLLITPSIIAEDVKFTELESISRDEFLRQELLEMRQKEREYTDRFFKTMQDVGFSFDENRPRTITQLLLARLLIFEEEGLERQQCKRMKMIVDQNGWPSISLVEKDGAAAAARLISTFDHDRAFQKKCLRLMETLPQGEVSRKRIAYLTDELLVAEGKKQKYGTELGKDFLPTPIEDAELVDVRRKLMGLPTLAVQTEMSQKALHLAEKKSGLNNRKALKQ